MGHLCPAVSMVRLLVITYRRLLLPFLCHNLRPRVFHRTCGFLTSPLQLVAANSYSSALSKVSKRIDQGSVVEPNLFLININDLLVNVGPHMLSFAGDCVMYYAVTNLSDTTILQNSLVKMKNSVESHFRN